MPAHTQEKEFESAIEHSLTTIGGYEKMNAQDYSPDLGINKYELFAFLQDSQPKAWEKSVQTHGELAEDRVLQRLLKEVDNRGLLDVLRNGFKDYGVKYRLAFFMPESSLNPETKVLYEKNRLKVARQVYFSSNNKKSVDLVLFLNGFPLATAEVKNPLTNQNISHAVKQYKEDRYPRELIFQFNKRSLVHFAVDPDQVQMCTHLKGKHSYFLPFNRGYQNGAGNPPTKDNYKTAYLWEQIWAKDSWMDILSKFLHLEEEEFTDPKTGKTTKKAKMIFPRYHQLDVVRKLSKDAREKGAGESYLIQHSAGSGKSNSIAWLSYRLSSLHSTKDERIFDSVIVITDRRVLDSQLQDTIFQFEHKTGVVQKIDKDSGQLAEALEEGKNIIITTLQKFPFVMDKLGNLPSRKYAIVIDEAHSSQGGEATKKMKEVLSAQTLEDAALAEAEQEEEDTEDLIRQSAMSRGHLDNVSFFAFTATPKAKTLEVFGTKDAQGKPKPFHLYSMRQAIQEGFILDVLQNYTTYEVFYKISKQIEDDPELNKKKATKAIGRFVSLHPYNLAQKAEVMIEHFRHSVLGQNKIGGKAKAMVVTSSRLHAKRYFQEFKKYLKEKGYTDMRVLVAFSGKVVDEDFPEGVSEPELTGVRMTELPDTFNKEEYKILIVADKYQTGFDQPLLHTMYVDKKLSGVKAVQTLSRLNRTTSGKQDTFVLDFTNRREDILDSFRPYYEVTTVEETTDPNHLEDLKQKLDQTQVYWKSEVDAFAESFFKSANTLKEKAQAKLYNHIEPAIDRFNELPEEEQDDFKKTLRTWTNLYSYLSQIMPFYEVEYEKFYPFAKYLHRKLPKSDYTGRLQLDDEVELEYYKMDKIASGAIALEPGGTYGLNTTKEAGMTKDKDEKSPLSEIVQAFNDRFDTEFTDADKLFFDQMEEALAQNEMLEKQAQSNSKENFKYGLDQVLMDIVIDRREQNEDIFTKLMTDKDFSTIVGKYFLDKLYSRFNKDGKNL